MKVVINQCYGGFSLSEWAIKFGRKLTGDPLWGGPSLIGDKYEDGKEVEHFLGGGRHIKRSDPILVEVVEKLGSKADGFVADLCVVEIPEGTLFKIKEYDGFESIEYKDSSDWQMA